MLSKTDFNPQKWHTLDIEEIVVELKGKVSAGFTDNEPLRPNQLFGPNLLTEGKHEYFWEEFLEELREPLILMLIGTGILYAQWGELDSGVSRASSNKSAA